MSAKVRTYRRASSMMVTTSHSQATRLTTQEKLLLSQAIYKLGAISWPAISNLLVTHPCCTNRPSGLFSPESCESIYMDLMAGLEINVPAPDAMKPSAKTHLRLAQHYYLLRMTELQETISKYENKFQELMNEINSLKNGEFDNKIRNEIRIVIARKYGKRLLDTWFPPDEELKQAMEHGPTTKEEEEKEQEKEIVGIRKEGDGEKEVQVEQVQEIEKEGKTQPQVPSVEEGSQDVEMADAEVVPQVEIQPEVDVEGEKPAEGVEGLVEKEVVDPRENVEAEKVVEPDDEADTVTEDIEVDGDKTEKKVEDEKKDEAEKTAETKKSVEDGKKIQDEEMKSPPAPSPSPSPLKTSRTKTPRQRRFSPAISIRSEQSPALSELSPPPSDQATPTNTTTNQTEKRNRKGTSPPTTSTTRSNKRKASVQPKGAPISKRSGRRSTVTVTSPIPSNHDDQEEEDKNHVSEEEEEDIPITNTRGRRNTSTMVGRRESTRNINKKLQESPSASASTSNIKIKDSSPTISRRAPSVSSTRSTPAPPPAEERRSSRRSLGTNKNITGGGTRGMRDEIVSKSVREQSAAISESVKAEETDDHDEEDVEKEEAGEEDEDEQEQKPVRSSSRRRGQQQDREKEKEKEREKEKEKEKETPVPAEKRGTRASARTVRDQSFQSQTHEHEVENNSLADISGDIELESNDGRSRNTPLSGIKGKPTQAQRSSQKLLYSLLDTISSHRNGNVFQNPVKKSEALDYYQIIKRPMDLKTLRIKIKEGQIGGIEEFERDVLLIFANAMMYNDPDSQVYEMAKEMLKSTEDHIAHFKNLQHHVSR